MKINVEDIKIVKENTILDIKFPYYGWWSSRKDGIIKMYPEYYEHDKNLLRHIVVIIVNIGFSVPTQIRREVLSVSNNIVDREFMQYLKDYADIATEKEFTSYRFQAIENLK